MQFFRSFASFFKFLLLSSIILFILWFSIIFRFELSSASIHCMLTRVKIPGYISDLITTNDDPRCTSSIADSLICGWRTSSKIRACFKKMPSPILFKHDCKIRWRSNLHPIDVPSPHMTQSNKFFCFVFVYIAVNQLQVSVEIRWKISTFLPLWDERWKRSLKPTDWENEGTSESRASRRSSPEWWAMWPRRRRPLINLRSTLIFHRWVHINWSHLHHPYQLSHPQSTQSDPSDRVSVTSSDCDLNEPPQPPAPAHTWITYCTWLVYFLVWATLYAIALELQFGAVFFMLSCLLGICLNLRDKSKHSNEVSAYSVFNENCESIDGTFKAEMFEQQLGVRKM